MPVAPDLQNIVADISAAIAGRKTYGRTELEKLRRQLNQAARTASAEEKAGTVSRLILTDLIDAVESGTANIVGAAAHARTRAAIPQGATAHN